MAMSGAQHGNGLTLLLGSRTRSYGSLVRSPPQSPGQSPVHHHHQRRIEHIIQAGETLQGLSLKYGVSMEQIKRANRLYTNDSIFLKMSLFIPVLSDLDDRSNGQADSSEQDGEEKKDNGHTGSSSEDKQDDDCNEQEEDEDEERASDLTPVDFLKRLDDLIHQSKQAAVRGCEEGEKRVADLEAACTGGESDRRPLTRSQSVVMSTSTTHRAKPLTVTKLTTKLKDREDEIFEL